LLLLIAAPTGIASVTTFMATFLRLVKKLRRRARNVAFPRRLLLSHLNPELEKSWAQVQTVGSERDGDEQSGAAEQGEQLQSFGYYVCTARQSGNRLNQFSHLKPPPLNTW
jgi:hypothetical protein